jgi:hypothetical protein
LNNGIVYDPQVRADYEARVQNLVERFVVPYPQFEFIIIPELEDSQTSDAAQAFYDLTVSHIPEGYNAFVAKNPVNNWDRYNGILEIHTEQLSETGHLVSNDQVSFDGQEFGFPGESTRPSFDEVKVMTCDLESRGIDIYYWRFEWQGLEPNGTSLPPDERTYTFGNYMNDIIDLLSFEC